MEIYIYAADGSNGIGSFAQSSGLSNEDRYQCEEQTKNINTRRGADCVPVICFSRVQITDKDYRYEDGFRYIVTVVFKGQDNRVFLYNIFFVMTRAEVEEIYGDENQYYAVFNAFLDTAHNLIQIPRGERDKVINQTAMDFLHTQTFSNNVNVTIEEPDKSAQMALFIGAGYSWKTGGDIPYRMVMYCGDQREEQTMKINWLLEELPAHLRSSVTFFLNATDGAEVGDSMLVLTHSQQDLSGASGTYNVISYKTDADGNNEFLNRLDEEIVSSVRALVLDERASDIRKKCRDWMKEKINKNRAYVYKDPSALWDDYFTLADILANQEERSARVIINQWLSDNYNTLSSLMPRSSGSPPEAGSPDGGGEDSVRQSISEMGDKAFGGNSGTETVADTHTRKLKQHHSDPDGGSSRKRENNKKKDTEGKSGRGNSQRQKGKDNRMSIDNVQDDIGVKDSSRTNSSARSSTLRGINWGVLWSLAPLMIFILLLIAVGTDYILLRDGFSHGTETMEFWRAPSGVTETGESPELSGSIWLGNTVITLEKPEGVEAGLVIAGDSTVTLSGTYVLPGENQISGIIYVKSPDSNGKFEVGNLTGSVRSVRASYNRHFVFSENGASKNDENTVYAALSGNVAITYDSAPDEVIEYPIYSTDLCVSLGSGTLEEGVNAQITGGSIRIGESGNPIFNGSIKSDGSLTLSGLMPKQMAMKGQQQNVSQNTGSSGETYMVVNLAEAGSALRLISTNLLTMLACVLFIAFVAQCKKFGRRGSRAQ